tara:strand:+ start:65 stop:547 length:483 start_codon:yes stop_codon:yes gene_type:complete
MVKQKGGKYQKGGMVAPGLGPVGMGAPGMGAPGMGSSLFGLGQLGNQDPYRSGAWSGQMDYTHGAMNGLNSMLGAQPRFHVLPELAQELSSLLYNQNGLMGLGNAMMPYQNSGYGSMFSPQGGYGQYGLFGGKKSKKSTKTRKAGAKKSNKKRKTKYNRK